MFPLNTAGKTIYFQLPLTTCNSSEIDEELTISRARTMLNISKEWELKSVLAPWADWRCSTLPDHTSIPQLMETASRWSQEREVEITLYEVKRTLVNQIRSPVLRKMAETCETPLPNCLHILALNAALIGFSLLSHLPKENTIAPDEIAYPKFINHRANLLWIELFTAAFAKFNNAQGSLGAEIAKNYFTRGFNLRHLQMDTRDDISYLFSPPPVQNGKRFLEPDGKEDASPTVERRSKRAFTPHDTIMNTPPSSPNISVQDSDDDEGVSTTNNYPDSTDGSFGNEFPDQMWQ